MLKVSNVNAGYGNLNVLRNISFEVKAGELVSILGTNGAGKTTLLRTLSGLISASSGEILFEGKPIQSLRPEEIVKEGLVQVPEGRMLFTEMTVRENLELGAYSKKTRKNAKKNLEYCFELFPILKERQKQRLASVATEMDEGNQYSKGHPAAHVVPVLLTMLQNREGFTGKQLLEILIKGYEACSRFGRASTLLPDAHAHGTWGVMGAAATALLIENVSKSEFCKGVNLSATFALPTMWKAALEGTLIRNIYAGHAIEMGIKSVAFLKTNHIAPENNISHVFSSVIGVDFDQNQLIRNEHDTWDIELNYFKPYAFCRYAHSPIDAFTAIINHHKLTPENIKNIHVYTYKRASSLASQEYSNVLSAKFSIPFALSVLIHKQKAGQTVFTEKLYEDKVIQEFAKKVFVHHEEELEKDYPQIMPAVVKVIDIDGNIFSERIDIAEGGPGKGLTEEEIIGKFNSLTGSVFYEGNSKTTCPIHYENGRDR